MNKTSKTKTPASVMGGQGKPATIPVSHFKNKATKTTKFPE
jgi:hypothetical protein